MGIINKIFKSIARKVLETDPEYQQLLQLNKNVLEKSIIDANAVIYPPFRVNDCRVNAFTYIAGNSKLSMVNIGKYCSIGPYLFAGYGIHPTDGISSSPMFYSTLKQNGHSLSSTNKIEERKTITIGNDVFIGANVTILDGITIGDGAVIGAGAVVSKDIPPYAIAVGCPIQILKYRFSEEQIKKLLEIKWWNFSNTKIKEVEINFFSIDQFLDSNYHD